MRIFENKYIFIKQHESSIPWLKIFTQEKFKELSDCDENTKQQIYKSLDIIEKTMIEFYNPEKINIAMFGNYLPHFHAHVMSRFKTDSHFPEPMWGEKQRDEKLSLPPFEEFVKFLAPRLRDLA